MGKFTIKLVYILFPKLLEKQTPVVVHPVNSDSLNANCLFGLAPVHLSNSISEPE